MAYAEHGRSLPDLLSRLATDATGLFRKEIQLAKTEASEKIDVVVGGAQRLAFGVILGAGAAIVLLGAIVAALAMVFIGMDMDLMAATALSAFIVGVVVGLIAWALISSAINSMKLERLNMDRTAHSLARDAAVVTEKF